MQAQRERPEVRESYLDARRLAETMGVSVRTVKRWTAAGMPSETWGMRTRRYLVSECIEWARQQADTVPTDHPPERRSNVAGLDRQRR